MVRPFIHPSSSNRFSKAAVHGAHTAGVAAPKNPMVGSRPVRCARADNGHAAAPRSTMNSRRRIAHPKAQDYADFKVGLQQGFATGETGFRISLHGSNLAPLMSALGQKRTFDSTTLFDQLVGTSR
jgi:hypothetical protein